MDQLPFIPVVEFFIYYSMGVGTYSSHAEVYPSVFVTSHFHLPLLGFLSWLHTIFGISPRFLAQV